MVRCVARAHPLLAWLLCAASLLAWALPAAAQVARVFPREALRGDLTVVDPPVLVVNAQPAQLAPGARIRGLDNMLVLSAQIVGVKMAVNFTTDDRGNVKDVWILRPEEAKALWPRTPAEATQWVFDPVTGVWAKP